MRKADSPREQLGELNRLLVERTRIEETFERIATLATELIECCDSCGVSLAVGGMVTMRRASDETAELADQIQYDVAGEGPCLDAVRSGKAVRADALASDDRWPRFGAAAHEAGVVASYSVPLVAGNDVVGSVNLYSSRRAFTDHEIAIADQLGAAAAAPVHNVHAYDRLRHLIGQLEQAVRSRDLIGQAKGILMERHGIDEASAFWLLRQQSQHEQRKLRDIAAELVAGHPQRARGRDEPVRPRRPEVPQADAR